MDQNDIQKNIITLRALAETINTIIVDHVGDQNKQNLVEPWVDLLKKVREKISYYVDRI